ncbi:MAG TPA: DUF4136 domain-containing protein [Candidatus Acidoferrales bacterium]|nr:DUF4136 domain-containing protein [Candidatus Acidoferrales bacterium]
MRKLVALTTVSLALLLVSGCHPVSIKTDHNPAANFGALQTYAWQKADDLGSGDPRFDTKPIDREIHNVVDAALTAKGYRKIDSGSPDFLVGYLGVLGSTTSTVTRSMQLGDSKGLWGFVGTSSVDYSTGSLVLQMSDPATNQMLWRSVASAVVDEIASANERRERIGKAVQKMIAEFPGR